MGEVPSWYAPLGEAVREDGRMDLVEFLRSRLKDRLENADSVHDLGCGSIRYDGTCDCGEPEMVRAEVEAKRRIVEHHQQDGDMCAVCDSAGPSAQGWPCLTLRLLALPYASDPAYREEWKP